MTIDPVLSAVLGSVGVPPGLVASCTPLAGGTYNAVTRVALSDGRVWVVKTPPPAAGDHLAYERDLLVNEVTFYTAAADAAGATAVPRVVHSGLDPAAPEGAYVVMTACPGLPWHTFTGAMADGEEPRLRGELGRIVGRLHGVAGPGGFGYPSGALGPLAPTWRQAFTTMTGAVLADARRYAARLPRTAADIGEVLGAASYVLDDVTRPAPVHFDLWQGNILVAGEPGARRIGGIVDGERMFWGDPAADFVSLALFGDMERDKDFLAGYGESAPGGPVEFDASLRLRLALYRSYLYLIMLVETVPRETAGERLEWTWNEVAPRLEAALGEVESALRGKG
ncbi:aminoglycoside phosphotransferase family protein [Streptomyces sp. ITFR-16]|uniref:phosphotransferase family protein n=1 Tax=Streptomyces sp. ITFR-16 TaxID=3075198 RepID=UPI00288BE3D0|nr:aminoglycoside phosphotransferase family protein [Streptomyces sp. ITFR-16]WNI23352.1 aminoglycoside phosphotransferase family protein [Streptomyces sp. ITFR-16]